MSATAASFPSHTDVANALGAVVGQVRVTAEAVVSQPKEGLFRLAAGEPLRDFTDERRRWIAAPRRACVPPLPSGRVAAGTDTAEIEVDREIKVATVEGQRSFIEARIVAVAAAGRASRHERQPPASQSRAMNPDQCRLTA